jgi:HAMP domain-containing protein
VTAIDDMQAKQRRAEALLARATSFDHAALTRAFAAATEAQSTASQVRLIISVGGLTLVMLLCLWLSHSVLRALRELGAGFSRFGQGDFAAPIRVLGDDEFGELAQQANEMASRLNALKACRARGCHREGEARGRQQTQSVSRQNLTGDRDSDLLPSLIHNGVRFTEPWSARVAGRSRSAGDDYDFSPPRPAARPPRSCRAARPAR